MVLLLLGMRNTIRLGVQHHEGHPGNSVIIMSDGGACLECSVSVSVRLPSVCKLCSTTTAMHEANNYYLYEVVEYIMKGSAEKVTSASISDTRVP